MSDASHSGESQDVKLGAVPHGRPPRRPTDQSTLRYRHRALGLLGFYIPLLIIPWVLTSLLVYHPLRYSSYFTQAGFTADSLKVHRRLINALSVLNSFASIVTIPIVSALLAQAAVVYTQRRRKHQFVSIRQTFALADRGWSNLDILREAWPPWKRSGGHLEDKVGSWDGSGSAFLWLAALFLLICAVQQPIREAIVFSEPELVMTTNDNVAAGEKYFYNTLGFEPEPDDMSRIPEDVVVQDLSNSLSSFSGAEAPQHLWPDLGAPYPYTVREWNWKRVGPWRQPHTDYFVAALPNGTTTGVLKHRIMRLNSTVTCVESNDSDYPSSCDGSDPFTATFGESGRLKVRICVPGQRGRFPWTVSRNRQAITEELFINVLHASNVSETFTRHCTARTERGYFEMGNYRNNNKPSLLFERWIEPDVFAEESDYNDWLPSLWRDQNEIGDIVRLYKGRWRRPSVEDRVTDMPGWPLPPSVDEGEWPMVPGSNNSNITMSGPLMTSIITMFGERSLFALANSTTNDSASLAMPQICQSGRMPFSMFSGNEQYADACADADGGRDQALTIMSRFVDRTFYRTLSAESHLAASM